jgi:hypothetical protein
MKLDDGLKLANDLLEPFKDLGWDIWAARSEEDIMDDPNGAFDNENALDAIVREARSAVQDFAKALPASTEAGQAPPRDACHAAVCVCVEKLSTIDVRALDEPFRSKAVEIINRVKSELRAKADGLATDPESAH